MTEVFIDINPKTKVVSTKFDYDVELISLVKTVSGRRWNRPRRQWEFPFGSLDDLRITLAKWRYPYRQSPALEVFIRDHIEKRRDLVDLKFASDADLNVQGLQSSLRPFQKVGASFLVRAKRALLADDMGLGKTIQTIALILMERPFPCLVLANKTIGEQWIRQFEEHVTGGLLAPVLIQGKPAEREVLWRSGADIIVATYELLIHDWERMPKKWKAVVCDEVTRVKSYKASITKRLKRLDAEYRVGLTGTPVENNLAEFHSIIDWIEPGLLGPGWAFVREHTWVDNWGKTHYKDLESIQLKVGPYMLRRTKDEVLTELPPKIVQDYVVELSAAERAEYRRAVKDFEGWLAGTEATSGIGRIVELLRFKQLACDPALLGLDIPSSKVAELRRLLGELKGHKVVVFTQFKEMAKRLEKYFPGSHLITGDTKTGRLAIIDCFAADESQLLVMTEVGAHGLNITCADYIIHYDFPWNPAKMQQREDRLHRIGQTQVVNVINMKAEHTIDEYIWGVLYAKRALADMFLGGAEEKAFEQLTRRDALALVRGEEGI